jgi:predicted membrane chloride channel (bestrophin family)
MVQLYEKEVGSDRKRRVINLVAAFPYLLRHHVRPGCLCEDKEEDIPIDDRLSLNRYSTAVVDTRYEGDSLSKTNSAANSPSDCWVNRQQYPWRLFEKGSLKKVARAQNRPLWVCDRVGREVMSIPYGPNFTSRERLNLLGSIEKLTNTVGQCERIHQTAVPLNYARHSLRSLTLWLVTLPFALVKDMGLLTGPVMAVISWLLFGVYQIGYSIEDPFQGSLRLSILCDAIRRDVMGETDARNTAFLLEDTWDDDDDDDHELERAVLEETRKEKNKKKKKKKLVLEEPIVANSGQADVILNQPALIQENGTWNVVGAVEG